MCIRDRVQGVGHVLRGLVRLDPVRQGAVVQAHQGSGAEGSQPAAQPGEVLGEGGGLSGFVREVVLGGVAGDGPSGVVDDLCGLEGCLLYTSRCV